MLKRITTAGVTLAALGAFALGGSVIASAKTPHHSPKSHAVVAESHTTEADGPGGPNVQSESQTGGPDSGTATAEKSGEARGTEADGPGGANVQSGGNTQQ